ncbi:MAG: flagellar basal body L-ring protein FlgH [Chthonomonadales bacterium]|nr:flagellar basal body L-ring protein FlgH [Chthonomonadales bacterium]
MKQVLLATCAVLAATLAAPARAADRPTGSLWGARGASMFADIRARKAGDTLTIIVQETATASSSASTKTSRDDKVAFGGVTGALSGLFRPLGITRDLLGPFGVSDSASTSGQGQTNRSGSLVTRITVMVKEVLPNGNLMVEGSRAVGVNAEKQRVTLRGVVRPQDIGPENTVSSIAVADAAIEYEGKGPVGARQRKGLLTTIFGWLF